MIILLLFCSKLYLVIFVNWWLFLGVTSFLNFTPVPNGFQVQVVPCKIQYLIILHYFLNLEPRKCSMLPFCSNSISIEFWAVMLQIIWISVPSQDQVWIILYDTFMCTNTKPNDTLIWPPILLIWRKQKRGLRKFPTLWRTLYGQFCLRLYDDNVMKLKSTG